MVKRDWVGLYREGWTGLIVPGAFSHPAKFSRGLIRRIYQYATAQGWLQAEQVVVDPFGGVALGALHAMQNGLHWIGVELEEKFVTLGQQNIDLWNARYADHLPAWGSAIILQGDSRRLCEMVGEAAGVVGSPPYTGGCAHTGGIDPKPEKVEGGHGNLFVTYGSAAGQLAALPEGDPREVIDGVCGSPPFEGSLAQAHGGGGCLAAENDERYAQLGIVKWKHRQSDYGDSDGQLGQSSGDTFWSASRQIMQQVYAILKPGGVTIWVCKRFVRKGQIVEFSQQWAQLGLACGFESLEWIRAWLVEDRGAQFALNGDLVERKVERKSFFRRLAESKGSPRIDWEDVIVQRKPG